LSMINLPPGLDLSFRPQGEIFPAFSQRFLTGFGMREKIRPQRKSPGVSPGLFLPEMS
jgi:hypothetical protein